MNDHFKINLIFSFFSNSGGFIRQVLDLNQVNGFVINKCERNIVVCWEGRILIYGSFTGEMQYYFILNKENNRIIGFITIFYD